MSMDQIFWPVSAKVPHATQPANTTNNIASHFFITTPPINPHNTNAL